MRLTKEKLAELGACPTQLKLFIRTFKSGVNLNQTVIKEHGHKFDIEWLAYSTLTDSAYNTFSYSESDIEEKYRKVDVDAYAVYLKAMEPTSNMLQENKEVADPIFHSICNLGNYDEYYPLAIAVHDKAVGPFQEAYNKAYIKHDKEYNKAVEGLEIARGTEKALVWWKLYQVKGNRQHG